MRGGEGGGGERRERTIDGGSGLMNGVRTDELEMSSSSPASGEKQRNHEGWVVG